MIRMIRFVFNERKTAQAAAYLLRLNGGRMKYMKLLKILYLADRESLLRTGRPITGDCYVSMDNGPILSKTYDLVAEDPEDPARPWFEYIAPPQDYSVEMRKSEPESDELSPFEIGLLGDLFERFKDVDQFALARLTHSICPEWRDPKGSSLPIAPEEILRVGGRSEEEIERIVRESQDLQLMAQVHTLVGPT